MDCWSVKLTHKIINKKAAEFSCVVAAWIMQMWWSQLVWKMRNKWKAELFLNEVNSFFYLFGQRKEINAHSKRFLCSRGFIVETIFELFISFRWTGTLFAFNGDSFLPSRCRWRHVKRIRMFTYSDRASTCNGSAYISFVWKRVLSSRFPSRIVLLIHVHSGHDAYDSIINVPLHISIIWQTHNYWFAIFAVKRWKIVKISSCALTSFNA